jgi:signal peptidase I
MQGKGERGAPVESRTGAAVAPLVASGLQAGYLYSGRMKHVLRYFRWNRGLEIPKAATSRRNPFAKLILLVVLSCASYLFFSRLVVTAVEVRGASMAPTLTAGDRFILNRFAYLHREPQRGELVVLKDPQTGELIVKRIVGLPCETVMLQGENTFVNGKRLREQYAQKATRAEVESDAPFRGAIAVPRDSYYVLGDNRARSVDSREFGPVPRENILGVIDL